jgi:ABC-type lipoprotein release transport system permease subunit
MMTKAFNKAVKDFNEARKRRRIAEIFTSVAFAMALVVAILIVMLGA